MPHPQTRVATVLFFICLYYPLSAPAQNPASSKDTTFIKGTTIDLASRLDGPDASPYVSLSRIVGIDKLRVAYYAPSVKGRKIWGEGGIVPNDTLWRLGANNSTLLSSTCDFFLDSALVPAGKHSLFLIPGDSLFTVVVSSQSDLWGVSGYSTKYDVARIKVKPVVSEFTEELMIRITDVSFDRARLVISWAHLTLNLNIRIDNNERIIRNYTDKLLRYSNVSDAWDLYYEAAEYCLISGKSLDKGIEWINQSIMLLPNTSNYLLKARILALSTKYSDAINWLDKTRQLFIKTDGRLRPDLEYEFNKLRENWIAAGK